MSVFLTWLGVWLIYECVRVFVMRRVRARWRAGAEVFVRRHRIQMESARFIDRVWIRERLAQDAFIEEQVLRSSRVESVPITALRRRVDNYVDEIAPFFSMSVYYRFGTGVARRFLDLLFEMLIEPDGFERQMEEVPEDAVRVYIINHRANMDPLVLAYGLLRHVPMSYAVGEWALVWPLDWLFRSFGSYFVRRGEKDPLYHAVLERFIQLVAGQGAVTGFFIEGALSRDGALRKPRTGLLSYIIRLRRDHPEREIVFMPVGLNYDRVLEDRILTRETHGPIEKPTVMERLFNVGALVFWVPMLVVANVYKVASGSHRKFGYAAVQFGRPLVLSEWPGGDTLHLLDGPAAEEAMTALGVELLYHRVGEVVPVTPVPLFAFAFFEDGAKSEGAVVERIGVLLRRLRACGAPIAFGRVFSSIQARRDQGIAAITPELDASLLDHEEAELVYRLATVLLVRRRVLRRALTPLGTAVELIDGNEDVLRYYALSLRHHLQRGVETVD